MKLISFLYLFLRNSIPPSCLLVSLPLPRPFFFWSWTSCHLPWLLLYIISILTCLVIRWSGNCLVTDDTVYCPEPDDPDAQEDGETKGDQWINASITVEDFDDGKTLILSGGNCLPRNCDAKRFAKMMSSLITVKANKKRWNGTSRRFKTIRFLNWKHDETHSGQSRFHVHTHWGPSFSISYNNQ